MKLKPEILESAVNSGRMKFKVRPMTDAKNREDVLHAAKIMNKAGTLPKVSESFFAV